MKKYTLCFNCFLLFVSISWVSAFTKPPREQINIVTLLQEMTDRDQIARFPQSNFRCLQASSYNRQSVSPDLPGWFADSDGEGFIRTEEINGKKEWVLMEDMGPGVVTKIWAVCFYYGLEDTLGANIKIYLDGALKPVIAANLFKLVKGQDFIKSPFADASRRAGNLYFPIPYAKSCKITLDKKAFYNIINYRQYASNVNVKTFTLEDFEKASAVRESVAKKLQACSNGEGKTQPAKLRINKGEKLSFHLPKGSGAIKQIEISLANTKNKIQALRSVVLTGTFDNEQTIWAPVGDFFSNTGRIKTYDMWERSIKPDGSMVCRWVMPYRDDGEITLLNLGDDAVDASLSITTGKWNWNAASMHFYATWRMDEPMPTFPLYDWNFLEATGKGVIVGDEWAVLNPAEGWWGEGDEKIYTDEDFKRNFPSHFGTGTEDYYGWAGGIVPTPADEFSKPFLGNIIVGEKNAQGYNVCTRTRVLDAIPFREKIKFDFEASCGTDRRKSYEYLQYAQTTFWYGVPGVKHNRPPLAEIAAAKLQTVEALQKLANESRKDRYVVAGAIEAETIAISNEMGAIENFAEIPVLGDLSNGAMMNAWFKNPGDFIECKLTEQFEKRNLKVCAAMMPAGGTFRIFVNDELKITQDFYTQHAGLTNPYINLGMCEPVNNAFIIRFEYIKSNEKAEAPKGRYALGIDFFTLDQ